MAQEQSPVDGYISDLKSQLLPPLDNMDLEDSDTTDLKSSSDEEEEEGNKHGNSDNDDDDDNDDEPGQQLTEVEIELVKFIRKYIGSKEPAWLIEILGDGKWTGLADNYRFLRVYSKPVYYIAHEIHNESQKMVNEHKKELSGLNDQIKSKANKNIRQKARLRRYKLARELRQVKNHPCMDILNTHPFRWLSWTKLTDGLGLKFTRKFQINCHLRSRKMYCAYYLKGHKKRITLKHVKRRREQTQKPESKLRNEITLSGE